MIRLVFLLSVLVVLLATPAAAQTQTDAGSPDAPGVELEPSIPEGPAGACDSLPWGVDTVCDGVGTSLALGMQPVLISTTQTVLHEMVSFVVEGAGWLLEQVASFLDTSTRPQLTASWFQRAYADMTVVAVFGLLPFLLLAIIQGIVRQDAGMLLRATFGYVPLAAVGTAAGVVIVDLLVQLTDLLTAWVGRSLGSDLAAFATRMGESLTSLPAGTGGPVAGLAALLAAGVVAFAAFAIWLELLLRQAAIYVAVLFLPLGFMAMVWPATAHWLRRLVQGLVAIILSKFVIVAVMALAAAALGGDRTPEAGVASGVAASDAGGFGVVLAGASMLAMAALAPYVLLRLIPVFDAGLSGELEGTYRRPTAAVASPTAGHHVLQTVRQHGGGGGGRSTAPVALDTASHREAEATGGPAGASGGPAATAGAPAGGGHGAASDASAGSGAGTPGASGGAPAGGGAGASGATVGTGVVAAGVGTVAAGAAGAKQVGEHLQRHGSEQQDAASGPRADRNPPFGSGSTPPQRSPAPDAGTPTPRPTTSPPSPKAPRERDPQEGS